MTVPGPPGGGCCAFILNSAGFIYAALTRFRFRFAFAACSRRRPTSLTTTWSPCTSQIPFWTETTACLRAQATTTWTPTTFQLTDDRVPGASKLRSLSACPTGHSVHGSILPKVQENCCSRRPGSQASGQLDGRTDGRLAGGRGLGAHRGELLLERVWRGVSSRSAPLGGPFRKPTLRGSCAPPQPG